MQWLYTGDVWNQVESTLQKAWLRRDIPSVLGYKEPEDICRLVDFFCFILFVSLLEWIYSPKERSQ